MATSDERTPLLAPDGATASTPLPNPTQETQLSSDPPSSSQSSTRQVAPDVLRGVLMILMALDHCSVALGAYAHGTGTHSEDATNPVFEWDPPIPFAIRTATHLVASGFSMLMGMGIAYFVESRNRQGWSFKRQLTHISIRAVAIALVNTLSIQLMQILSGKKAWLLNAVLLALAVDYLVLGAAYVLWTRFAEPAIVRWWDHMASGRQGGGINSTTAAPNCETLARARGSVAWSANAVLVLLSAVALWVNIWTSPHRGICPSVSTSSAGSGFVASDQSHSALDLGRVRIAATQSPPELCSSPSRILWEFLIRPITCAEQGVWSGFPPVGWLSFVLFGIAYGRVLIATRGRRVSAQTINTVLAAFFAVLFVSTRLFDWGNLSSHCLRTIDQQRQRPGSNQYLASIRSFLYIVKYPPSPAFAFGTLSGNFALLALFDLLLTTSNNLRSKLQSPMNPLLAYGGQPLFFYLAHFWTIYLIIAVLRISGAVDGLADANGLHVGLGAIFFGSWFALLCVMYPLCLSYGRWKQKQGPDSVWKFL